MRSEIEKDRASSAARSRVWLLLPALNGCRCCMSVGLVLILILACPGCSIRRMAVNKVGDALAGSGTSFASDDDPELIKDAAPFSLKLMESLLAESPLHKKLLLALASGFTQYAYAFVQQEAEVLETTDLSAAMERQARARRLYLRARDYGLRGLELTHPGLGRQLRVGPKGALKAALLEDVPQLYWTAAPWAAAVSLSKDNPDLIADLPIIQAMMDRALELDETFGHGAIHNFFIGFEASRAEASGDPAARSRAHFERSIALSRGQLATPFVALAESVCVQKQDLKEFESLLQRALAINPDEKPEFRLMNLVLQRRARWLLSRTDELFLQKDSDANKRTQ